MYVFNFGLGSAVLLMILYAILQWLHIPTGNFLDWVIGIASFWWLIVIVTVPWNIYFEAKQAIDEADFSREKGTKIDEKQVQYAQKVATRSLIIALVLHITSALGLYSLAATGISAVGYISSGAALLLTALRPAIRTYEYLAARLAVIRQEFQYPREDIWEVRHRLAECEERLRFLNEKLNAEFPDSWVSIQQRTNEDLRKELTQISSLLRQQQAENMAEHERLNREAKNAIAQLSEDSQFLGHVREILRFIKTA